MSTEISMWSEKSLLLECTRCYVLKPTIAFNQSKGPYDGGYTQWCKLCHAERAVTYRQKYPEIFAANNAARRAMILSRTPDWLTDADFKEMKAIYAEARRLTTSSGIKMHVDHIIPLQGFSVSGFHVPSNLQIIPATQNLKKGRLY